MSGLLEVTPQPNLPTFKLFNYIICAINAGVSVVDLKEQLMSINLVDLELDQLYVHLKQDTSLKSQETHEELKAIIDYLNSEDLDRTMPFDVDTFITSATGEFVFTRKELTEGQSLHLGRRPSSNANDDSVLIDSLKGNQESKSFSEISRSHASITLRNGNFELHKLTTSQTLELNGQAVDGVKVVKNDDIIRLSGNDNYRYQVVISGTPAKFGLYWINPNYVHKDKISAVGAEASSTAEPVVEAASEAIKPIESHSMSELPSLREQIQTFKQRLELIPADIMQFLPIEDEIRHLKNLLSYFETELASLKELVELFSEPVTDKGYEFNILEPQYGTNTSGGTYISTYREIYWSKYKVDELVKKAQTLIPKIENFLTSFRIIDSIQFYQALDAMADRVIAEVRLNPHNVSIYIDPSSADRSHGYVSWLLYLIIKNKSYQAGVSTPRVKSDQTFIRDDEHVFVVDDFVLSGIKMSGYLPSGTKKRLRHVTYLSVAKGLVSDQPDLESYFKQVREHTPDSVLYFSSTVCDCDYTFTANPDVKALLREFDAFPFKLELKWKEGYETRDRFIRFNESEEGLPVLLRRFNRIYERNGFLRNLKQQATRSNL